MKIELYKFSFTFERGCQLVEEGVSGSMGVPVLPSVDTEDRDD